MTSSEADPVAEFRVLAVRGDHAGTPNQSAQAWTMCDLGTDSGERSPACHDALGQVEAVLKRDPTQPGLTVGPTADVGRIEGNLTHLIERPLGVALIQRRRAHAQRATRADEPLDRAT